MERENKLDKRQTSSEGKNHWVELISTIVMAIATVATAWSSYQASRWGGVMSINFNQAGAHLTESTRSTIVGGQKAIFDALLFNEWLKAENQDDEALAEFYFERMGDLRPAVEAWIATQPLDNPDAPRSPFVMEEYVNNAYVESQQLEVKASELFNQGLVASQQSDDYILNAVIFASVLFFAGISTRFKRDAPQISMLVMGCVFLLFGLFNILISPIF